MKTKTFIINLIIVLTVTAFTVYFLITKNVFTAENLSAVSFFGVILVFVVYLFSIFVYALCHYLCVKDAVNNFSYKNAVSDLLFGRLGSDVTPFKSAHFPLRIYYYIKKGFSFYEGLTAVTRTQIIASFASVINYGIISVVLLVLGTKIIVLETSVPLFLVSGVGLTFHIGSLTLAMLLAFVKPFQEFCIKLISKVKYGKKQEKREEFISVQTVKYKVYREQVKLLLKGFYRYFSPLFIYIVYMYIFSSFIYLSYLLVSGTGFTAYGFITFYLFTLCSSYITNVIPLPGGNGSSEAVFLLVFPLLIAEKHLPATLLTWRISSYYLPVIFGIIFFLIVVFKDSLKRKIKT